MLMTSVFCLALSTHQADEIVHGLKMAGFSNDNISAVFPGKKPSAEWPGRKNTRQHRAKQETNDERAAWQAIRRAGFVSISAFAIPGGGSYIVSGAIIFAMNRAVVSGTLGRIAHGLTRMGVSEFQARDYEYELNKGNILISAQSDEPEEIEQARKLFNQAGAQEISITREFAVKENVLV